MASKLRNFEEEDTNQWVSKYNFKKPKKYCRYVDELFCIFENQLEIQPFHEYAQRFDFFNADCLI